MQTAASESRAPIAPMFDRAGAQRGHGNAVGASPAARCSTSSAPARPSSSASAPSCPATTCSASSQVRPTRTARRIRFASRSTRKGVTVRSRRALLASPEAAKPKNAREAVVAALSTPLPVSALPLRVATFSLQDPDGKKVQLADSRRRRHATTPRRASCRSATSSPIDERPHGRQPDRDCAAAAGDERRAVGAAVLGRRQPPARRLHAEARRGRRRSGGHGRARIPRRASGRPGRCRSAI